MWTPYEERSGHPQDFNVHYRFYSHEEGGKQNLPTQGYRCDFAYQEDDINETGIYMIYPEFEDNDGNVLLDYKISVNQTGTARMWILSPEMREEIHKHKIKIGTKGYFMEGSSKVGEVEVIRIVGLLSNQ
ncbi:hypothetical protein [Bacillus sp. AFS088145]|uniref:hypothetical protein n=1 Tax=Bacillus sp. AFS088145 TaxID=2033514 RepID=UPI000BF38BBB|nr:hypothetical protein [Bacillus sp. AFS088145]PFH81135.1 hypothetical protein COI44_23420 [Bacillus sp. AFS088145]